MRGRKVIYAKLSGGATSPASITRGGKSASKSFAILRGNPRGQLATLVKKVEEARDEGGSVRKHWRRAIIKEKEGKIAI